MGNVVSDRIADRTCREVSGLFGSPRRLRNHAGGQFLPVADYPYDRHLPSSAEVEKERQRSVLEKLIASVEPDDATLVSKALITEFASLSRIFAERKESLQRVIGPRNAVIDLLQATHAVNVAGLRAEIPQRLLSSTDQRLIDYLAATMGALTEEALRIIFLSRSNHVISDEIITTGSVHSLAVYPRAIFKRAFELAASTLLIVHNHPGGNIEPSSCDIDFTNALVSLGKSLEVEVKDHIIIAGSQWFSFLRWGLL
jgi:DNA repair protein RadC